MSGADGDRKGGVTGIVDRQRKAGAGTSGLRCQLSTRRTSGTFESIKADVSTKQLVFQVHET
jgi:hypothetical protein